MTTVIVAKDDVVLMADDIIDFFKSETPLAGFEIPTSIIFEDEIPQTLGGQVQKFELQEKYSDYYREKRVRASGFG